MCMYWMANVRVLLCFWILCDFSMEIFFYSYMLCAVMRTWAAWSDHTNTHAHNEKLYCYKFLSLFLHLLTYVLLSGGVNGLFVWNYYFVYVFSLDVTLTFDTVKHIIYGRVFENRQALMPVWPNYFSFFVFNR